MAVPRWILLLCLSSVQTVSTFHTNGLIKRQRASLLVYSSFKEDAEEPPSRRRNFVTAALAAASSLLSFTPASLADINLPSSTLKTIRASWSAVDGLNSNDNAFVSFDPSAYRAMRDDPTRTPLFVNAIKRRLGEDPSKLVVLDLGTGPFALFAILAAQLGAGRVYAIEANPNAAQSARRFVKQAGLESVVTILDGFSTKIELPEKVDFCIAEIVGSIASEEGLYATICDAHRFLKEPTREDSWIPCRVQTYGAPASYTLHNLLGPPEFDWDKLGGEPVRFNCRDKGLELLSDAVLMEDLVFSEMPTKQQKERNARKEFTFTIDKNRIDDNALDFFGEFRTRSSQKDSERLAFQTSRSLSGIACWPRLFLDDQTIVESRSFPEGGHQRSHWQTVLPIMASRPIRVDGGETLKITIDFDLPSDVTRPPRYSIEGVLSG